MRTRRTTAAAIIAMALAAVPAAPARALTASDVASQIRDLRSSLGAIARDLNDAERRLSETDAAIRLHERALAQARARSVELRDAISEHAANLYMYGSLSGIDILTGEGIGIYVDRMAYLDTMQRGERVLLEEAVALKDRAALETRMLEATRAEAAAARRLLDARRRELSSKLAELSRLQSFFEQARAGAGASRSGGRGMYCPLIGPTYVSNNFGDPRPGGPHQGVDLQANVGQWVRAVLPGTITETPYGSWWGIGIVLRDLAGNEWWYAHLSSEQVSPGTRVSAGELIGRAGCTGTCYGSHLHFEYHPGGGNAVDPYSLVTSAC